MGLFLVGLVGCEANTYLGDAGVFQLALLETSAPLATYRESALFKVERAVIIPMSGPQSEEDWSSLWTDNEGLPWERRPWLERHDYELEIDWTLTNLDDVEHTLTLYVNGRNEFDHYLPQYGRDLAGLVPDTNQFERTLALAPLGELAGTIREDQLDEVAVDLASVVNGASDPAYLMTHASALDPDSAALVPPIVPGLTMLYVGLQVLRPLGSELDPDLAGANVVLEFSVRVRDRAGRLVAEDQAFLPNVREVLPADIGG